MQLSYSIFVFTSAIVLSGPRVEILMRCPETAKTLNENVIVMLTIDRSKNSVLIFIITSHVVSFFVVN